MEKNEEIKLEIIEGRINGYLTLSEWAKKIHVTPATVSHWVSRGKIEHVRIGPLLFFKEDTPYPEERKRGKKRKERKERDDGMDIFGRRVEEVLKTKGLTQENLSEMIDIPATTISRYITSKTIPRLEYSVKIAKALGVSLDYLTGITDIPTFRIRE